MSVTKTIITFQAKLITLHSSRNFDDIIHRLGEEANKEGGGTALSSILNNPQSREELTAELQGLLQHSSGFLYFGQYDHQRWLKLLGEDPNPPKAMVYIIGNPFIAQTMLKFELRTSFNVPPRVLILELNDGTTDIIYHQPSSVISINHNAELREAAEALDAKLEAMLTRVARGEQA